MPARARAEVTNGSSAASTDDAVGLRTVPPALLAVLAILLAAALVFDVVMALRTHTRAQEADTRAAAVQLAFNAAPASAEKAAVQVLSYDYQTLQQDADEAKTYMTPQYGAKYQNTVQNLLSAPATKVKAHVEAKVMASGVASVTPSRVDVLMFIDQISSTTANAQPQTNLNRVVFTMVKNGDRWLVDNITAL